MWLAGCEAKVPPRAEDAPAAHAGKAATGAAASGTLVVLDQAVPEAALLRARAAADQLGGAMMSRLMQELAADGPAAAVKVCSEVAQEIADEQRAEGLTIRRVSLKVRNPADTPDAYEHAKLEWLAEQHATGALPQEVAEVVRVDGTARQLRYLRPIRIVDLCLNCHGPEESLDASVRAVLVEAYPDDAATGYAAGDLRGAFSVVVALGE
jgi:flagellar hook-length control protein FliK